MISKTNSKFNSEFWDNINEFQKKRIIKREIETICEKEKLVCPNILFKDLPIDINANINFSNNIEICFNSRLLNKDTNDAGNSVLAIIYHEIEHLKQYYMKQYEDNAIKIGVNNTLTNINYSDKIWKTSLYISHSFNKFMQSVYVLQPNEFLAHQAGKQILSIVNNQTKSPEYNKIESSILYLKKYYGEKNYPLEIRNALLNLYDNKNRTVSEEVQDLVTRCAICSYYDKEDYGIDKISLFLGECYENKLLKHE